MSELVNIVEVGGTPWSKSHDPEDNLGTIDAAITGLANVVSGSTTITGAVANSANVGTVGTNVTAVEYGDGIHHKTVLTLTDVVLGAPTAAGNSAHGAEVYAFPAGVHLHSHSWFSIGLTVGTTTTDAPDVGLGSVVGAGAIATLNGTTMEDYVTAITWGTALDGTAEIQATIGATAGVFTGISNNAAADVKEVFLNAADGWAAGVTGNLTASGTIVLIWDSIA